MQAFQAKAVVTAGIDMYESGSCHHVIYARRLTLCRAHRGQRSCDTHTQVSGDMHRGHRSGVTQGQ
jgi:hypothetical protein